MGHEEKWLEWNQKKGMKMKFSITVCVSQQVINEGNC